MNRCPVCYRSHAATVEVCDCGRQLKLTAPMVKAGWRQLFATPVPCPKCGQASGLPASEENNGFGLVTVTFVCGQCRQLYMAERWGLPQTPLLWLGICILVIWFAFFADEVVRSLILLFLGLTKVLRNIFASADERA